MIPVIKQSFCSDIHTETAHMYQKWIREEEKKWKNEGNKLSKLQSSSNQDNQDRKTETVQDCRLEIDMEGPRILASEKIKKQSACFSISDLELDEKLSN